MINKTKKIKKFKNFSEEKHLFMVPKTPTEFTSYKFSGVSTKYNFPKFSLVENNLNDRYVLVKKTIREYSLFKNYSRSRSRFSTNKFLQRLLLIKDIYSRRVSLIGTQIDKNKGGNLAASLGFISFVPRRYRAVNARSSQSFMSLKLAFRRYRRFSYLFNIKVNLVSTFRSNNKVNP